MSDLPKSVEIMEEGPREGFQSEPASISTEQKVRLIEALAETGLREIVCASFVSTKRVPQMAEAEAIAATITRKPGIEYSGVWLNEKGFERARNSGLKLTPVIFGSPSETFLMRNNNRTTSASLEDQRHMLQVYDAAELGAGPIYIFTAFGCNYEGEIPLSNLMKCAEDLLAIYSNSDRMPSHLCLCDTIGAANPELVRRVVGEISSRWPEIDIGLHLHDTRGLGIANAFAGLQMGVARFDASIGGLGGCPFAGNKSAAGNISTEDLVFLCEEVGIETGVDLETSIEVAKLAQEIVGHSLPGRMMNAGRWRKTETET